MKALLFIGFLLFYSTISFSQASGNSNKNFNLKDCKNILITDTIFRNPEVAATYPGGEKEWQKYLKKNIDLSIGSDNNAPEGVREVTVRFVVNKDGDVCSVRAETRFGFGIEEEIIRVIKKSKNWNPALINGIPVISYKRLTVNYGLVYL